MIAPTKKLRRVIAAGLLLGGAAGAAVVASDDRVAHLALPTFRTPASTATAVTALQEGAACEVKQLATLPDRISALLETHDGTLWIGTFQRGLYTLPPRSKTPIAVRGLTGRALFINALAEGRGGEVLAATNGGLVRIDRGETPSLRRQKSEQKGSSDPEFPGERRESGFLLRFLSPLQARATGDGRADGVPGAPDRVRAGVPVGGAGEGRGGGWDGAAAAVTIVDGTSAESLAATPDGARIFVGTSRGLRVYEEGAVAPASDRTEALRITALTINAGRLWMGTPRGVWSIDLDVIDDLPRWHPLVFGPNAASTNGVLALAAAQDGVIASTDDGGLVYVRGGADPIAQQFDRANANLGNPNAAASWAERAVFGTQGGGLLFSTITKDNAFRTVSAEDPRLRSISAVTAGRRLFAGTDAGALLALACRPTPGV